MSRWPGWPGPSEQGTLVHSLCVSRFRGLVSKLGERAFWNWRRGLGRVAGVRAGRGCGWCRAESVGWVSGSGWVFAGVTSAWGLRALRHWNFYPGAGRVALRQKDIPMKMTQGGVGAASLLTSVQPGPRLCPGGHGAARCRGLHSLLGRPCPEVIREWAELRMGLACCSLGLP